MYTFVVVLLHIGIEQISFQMFFPAKRFQKMAILRFVRCTSQWAYFQGQKIIYLLPIPHSGTPCVSVSPKTGLF